MVRTSLNRVFWRAYFSVYDRLNRAIPYQQLLRDTVNRLQVKPAGNYLDLGCGTGNSTAELAKHLNLGACLVGIDRSATAVSLAEAKLFSLQSRARAFFWQHDFDQGLKFNDKMFDGVLANNVIYLVKDPVQTLAEVLRILKPGANFVMSNPRRGASPHKILREHLRLKHQFYRENSYGFAGLRTVFHGLAKFADFLRLLPFQLLLKSGQAVEARFWDPADWQEVFDQLNSETRIPFEVSPPQLSYADQNFTFTLTRLPE